VWGSGDSPREETKEKRLGGRAASGVLRFGMLRGLRSIEIDPEAFRRELSNKYGVCAGLRADERCSTRAVGCHRGKLIRNAGKLALAEGVGFGFGGALTLIRHEFAVVITLRLIQRLSLPIRDSGTRSGSAARNVGRRRRSNRGRLRKRPAESRFWSDWLHASPKA